MKTYQVNKSLINDKLGRLHKDNVKYLAANGMNFIYEPHTAALYLHKNEKGLLIAYLSIEGFWNQVKTNGLSLDTVKAYLEKQLADAFVGANTKALMNYMYHHYFQGE